MLQDSYVGRLRDHGLEVVVADGAERADVHRIIYDELVWEVVHEESRERSPAGEGRSRRPGCRGPRARIQGDRALVGPSDASRPLYDTTAIHAENAVDWMLADG